MSSLTENNLALVNLAMVSRDDPFVMRKVHDLLEAAVVEKGNPAVISAPCYIHPCHTAFKKGLEDLSNSLGYDILS